MQRTNVKIIARGLRIAMKKHSPEILTGIGITGMITTTVMAVRATPKALYLIEKEKKNKQLEQLKIIEVVETTWKCYIPSAIIGILSTVCLLGSVSVNIRRNAALTTAYTLSSSALRDYQKKVVETLGEKKEHAIRDAVAKDKVMQTPLSNTEVFITRQGDTLCLDLVSGRYFKSNIEKIRKAVNDLNRQMRDEMSISLNELYYEIGLNGIDIGDDLGWNIENGYIDIYFSSQLADDGTPCLVIEHTNKPQYNFQL